MQSVEQEIRSCLPQRILKCDVLYQLHDNKYRQVRDIFLNIIGETEGNRVYFCVPDMSSTVNTPWLGSLTEEKFFVFTEMFDMTICVDAFMFKINFVYF
jgi:hypothetical protein